MEYVFAIDSHEVFETVSNQILNSLHKSSCGSVCQIDTKSFEAAKQEIKKCLSDNEFDLNKIAEVISNRGWEQDNLKTFLTLLEQKKSELMYAELNNHISAFGETVTGFDWLMKMVLGSSDLKTLRYPLFQLIFSTVNCNGDQKPIGFDLCKDNLLKMINLLENCID